MRRPAPAAPALAALLLEALVCGALLPAPPAAAQISPGELSLAHASVDGSGGCGSCHDPEKGVDAGRCLDCHRPLRRRLDAGSGLHAQPGYERCERCHIEHHGRGFELVWWGEGQSAESFDHRLADHGLAGRHAELGCRDCHRETLVGDAVGLRAAGTDPGRTFLGLDTACLGCHRDEHRGQLAAVACLGCHTEESWRPAPRFDHQRTSYPLTGRHREAACESCHRALEDPAGAYAQYRGTATGCASCHRDPHGGRLGRSCDGCHQTGWARLDRDAFDHRLARFTLEGKHRDATCDNCHKSGLTAPIPGFASCRGCHADTHGGQLAGRPDGGDCAACHDVQGFRPARYDLASHQESSYPLAGAHLAVPCIACHLPVTAAELGLAARLPPGQETTLRLRFASTGCPACHADPHDFAATAADPAGADPGSGCLGCHDLDGWRDVALESIELDHERTAFRLDPTHRRASCVACHLRTADPEPRLPFRGAPKHCGGCHADPHEGQLDAGAPVADCGRCHASERWRPSLFDHDRDSRYRLDGAHRKLACGACHPAAPGEHGPVIRYRPLRSGCTDCHGAAAGRGSPDALDG